MMARACAGEAGRGFAAAAARAEDARSRRRRIVVKRRPDFPINFLPFIIIIIIIAVVAVVIIITSSERYALIFQCVCECVRDRIRNTYSVYTCTRTARSDI